MRTNFNYLIFPVVLFGVLAALLLLYAQGLFGYKDAVNLLTGIFGTFLGAVLAFRLNETKEQQRVASLQNAAMNRALFVLSRQYNALKCLAVDLNPYVTEFDRAFNLQAMKPPPYSDLIQQFHELDFLINGGPPNVLMHLTIEQECFFVLLDSLTIRNEFYVSQVQPAMARLGLNGRSVSVDSLRAALGDHLYGTALAAVENVYRNLRSSEKSLANMITELHETAKKLFPEDKFIRLETGLAATRPE